MKKRVIILALALVVLSEAVSANFAPLISNLDSEILVCESSKFSLVFDVTELDGDDLTVGIFPSGPFFVRPVSYEAPITKVEIFSNDLTKLFSNKVYEHIVFVTDGELADSKEIKITVLEANNPPEIEHIPVETVDLSKTSTFTKKIKLTDRESGKPEQGRFSFTVSDSLNLLEMNIDNKGIINYAASESHVGTHEITVCATDSGIENLEGKIGICTPDEFEATACNNFQLAIVQTNSPPTILAFNSTNSSGKIAGTQKLTLQVFKYDADKIHPDTYWYVDDKLKQINAGEPSDKFVYSFGCGVSGKHKISAVISDGLMNDSIDWTFDVIKLACPEEITSSETIGEAVCEEKWGCLNFGLCQNALQSRNEGNLEDSEYEFLNSECSASGFDGTTCGYQRQICTDLNSFNTIEEKPLELVHCHFSLEPSCFDGIQNCHDSRCEFLADCGGPCDSCPTCSDGIKNQGEEKTDCGGPCHEQCSLYMGPEETDGNFLKQNALVAIFVAFLIAAVQVFRVVKTKQKLEEQPKTGLALAHE